MIRLSRPVGVLAISILVGIVSLVGMTQVHAAVEADDEIHSSFGDDASQMWVYWHGPDADLHYGVSSTYDSTAQAQVSTITPVDTAGPFWQVKLTGLQAGTTYHYAVGASGLDHTFQTAPTGDFTWDDIGDTGTSYYNSSTSSGCNKSWMPQVWQQLASEQPNFVTHGGDISYANECGVPAVHQFWNDIAPIATQAPIEFAWGNHEYGSPDSTAPAGTPRDSMANYKGRYNMANAQTVPIDGVGQTSNPGCPAPGNPSANGCRGDDWGSFTAGHVLFISYPEPWSTAYSDWKTKAGALMAQAEADPNIYFIVTYGHRPAYSSQASNAANPDLQAAVNALGDLYSPTARPDGKYVLNVGHHVHAGEVFSPQHGVVNVTDGGGGSEEAGIKTKTAGSLWLTNHLSHMRTTVTDNQMTINFICGPVFTLNPTKEPCTQGAVMYSQTLTGYKAGPPQPQLNLTYNDGVSSVQAGQQLTYTTTLKNTGTAATTGTSLSAAVPSNGTFVSATDGATPDYTGTVTWDTGDLAAGQTISKQITVTLNTLNPGDKVISAAGAGSSDGTCQLSGSTCAAVDTDSVPQPPPASTEWILNPSVETNLNNWTTYNTTTTFTRVTNDAHDGAASVQIVRKDATLGIAGIISKPDAVTSTTAGKVYSGSVWVRSQAAGQSIVLILKEFKGSTTVGSSTITVASNDTTWHQINLNYTAKNSGDTVRFILYASNLSGTAWFHADSMSLTSPN